MNSSKMGWPMFESEKQIEMVKGYGFWLVHDVM